MFNLSLKKEKKNLVEQIKSLYVDKEILQNEIKEYEKAIDLLKLEIEKLVKRKIELNKKPLKKKFYDFTKM
jgi:peptidoglycan hydrolase CwlO-like protein